MEEQNNFDQHFKQAGEHFAPTPPPQAWKHIANTLDARTSKKRLVWWVSSAAAACLLLGIGMGYYFGRTEAPDVVVPLAVEQAPKTKDPSQPAPLDATDFTGQRETSLLPTLADIPPVNGTSGNREITSSIKEVEVLLGKKQLLYRERFTWAQLTINRQAPSPMDVPTKVEDVEYELFAEEESSWNWSAAAMGSPLLAFQDARANGAIAQRNLDQEEVGGYSVGMGLRVQRKGNWEYQLGLSLTALQKVTNNPWMELSPMGLTSGTNSSGSFELNNSGNASTTSSPNGFDILAMETTSFTGTYVQIDAQLNQNINYLDIPLGVGYYLVQNRFGLMANLGLTPRIVVQQAVSLSNANGQDVTGTPTANNRLGLLGWAGFTASYQFSNRLSWEVLPQIGYGLVPQISTGEVVNREHQVAVFTGLRYRF